MSSIPSLFSSLFSCFKTEDIARVAPQEMEADKKSKYAETQSLFPKNYDLTVLSPVVQPFIKDIDVFLKNPTVDSLLQLKRDFFASLEVKFKELNAIEEKISPKVLPDIERRFYLIENQLQNEKMLRRHLRCLLAFIDYEIDREKYDNKPPKNSPHYKDMVLAITIGDNDRLKKLISDQKIPFIGNYTGIDEVGLFFKSLLELAIQNSNIKALEILLDEGCFPSTSINNPFNSILGMLPARSNDENSLKNTTIVINELLSPFYFFILNMTIYKSQLGSFSNRIKTIDSLDGKKLVAPLVAAGHNIKLEIESIDWLLTNFSNEVVKQIIYFGFNYYDELTYMEECLLPFLATRQKAINRLNSVKNHANDYLRTNLIMPKELAGLIASYVPPMESMDKLTIAQRFDLHNACMEIEALEKQAMWLREP